MKTEMKNFFLKHKKGWIEKMEMNPVDYEITRALEQLDDVSRRYEAEWGVGVLERHAAGTPLGKKWAAQIEKLNAAIMASDLPLVRELVEGTIRGWGALESHAKNAGHAPIGPAAWECRHPESGNVYRIVRTLTDTLAPAQPGTRTYALEEIVRLLEKGQLANIAEIKAAIPGSTISAIDWAKGDSIPF